MARKAGQRAKQENAGDLQAVVSRWVETETPSSSWRERTAAKLDLDLDALDAQGFDTEEVRDALETFRSIDRDDYERDDGESFRADLEDAWSNVLEAVAELKQPSEDKQARGPRQKRTQADKNRARWEKELAEYREWLKTREQRPGEPVPTMLQYDRWKRDRQLGIPEQPAPALSLPSLLPTEIPVDFGPILALVLDGLDSLHSKAMYARALEDFLSWLAGSGRDRLDKAAVQAYRAELAQKGLAPSSINQKLSAIRKLASEAADNGLMDLAVAAAVGRVKGVKSSGGRLGNWLPRDRAQELLGAPDTSSLKGLKDRAVLAVLLGCGLRREEAAALTFGHVQQRDGRWVIVDLVGKGKRVRSVPMPSWAKVAIDQWAEAAGISEGHVFRPVNKGGRVAGETVSSQAIADVVKLYAARIGVDLDAHDCRRTFAQLAHRGGSPLEQIQLSLGHSSIRTTEIYLGVQQDLTDAPCDHLGLRLEES